MASMFTLLYRRRTLALLALVLLAVVFGKAGVHGGLWDGPLGG